MNRDQITHRFPLERIEEAFDINICQQGLKVAVLQPGSYNHLTIT